MKSVAGKELLGHDGLVAVIGPALDHGDGLVAVGIEGLPLGLVANESVLGLED